MSVDDKTIIRFEDDNFNPIDSGIGQANNWIIKKFRLAEDTYIKKGKAYLVAGNTMRPGDIFSAFKGGSKYYVTEFKGFHPYGGQIYELKRVDKYPVVQFDIDKLKKGKWIQIYGYFNNKQCK